MSAASAKAKAAKMKANAKMKAAKMKADAKKKAAKMKTGSPNKKKGTPKSSTPKTGTPKTGYKYERIESKSEMPKFKLEKEKKVKMKKKDLKLKKQSPSKMKEKSPAKMKTRKAKKAVKKGMTPDEALNKGLVKNKDYNKLLKSRAYKKQRADEAGYKSVRKAKKAAKANDGFLPEGPAKMKEKSPMNMSGRSYDMKMAYNKKLTPKARLHYLENERHDKDSAMKMGSPYEKHGSPYHMGRRDSPMNKELVGKQNNLPEHLKKKIEAAPEMKGSPYRMSNELKYGGPVIDQMKTLSQAGSFKVLKHMKSKI